LRSAEVSGCVLSQAVAPLNDGISRLVEGLVTAPMAAMAAINGKASAI
jgi:hypothetical protein